MAGANLIRTAHDGGDGIACSEPAASMPVNEVLRAGIGLRAIHHREVLTRGPSVGWFEAHSENYFARGGMPRAAIEGVRRNYPLSLHGVGLSMGSTDPLDATHLAEIVRLTRELEPMLVSEHLSWGSAGGRFTNDLLPLPYTEEALRHMVSRVDQVQAALGRQMLIENVSSYLQFAHSQIDEWDFLAELARQSGCGLLLDVNNLYVNARNFGFDAVREMHKLPAHAVGEIHLAGHMQTEYCLIDTHGSRVCEEVWSLYGEALRHVGTVPTLIEWDTDLPSLDVLLDETVHANGIACMEEAAYV